MLGADAWVVEAARAGVHRRRLAVLVLQQIALEPMNDPFSSVRHGRGVLAHADAAP